MTGAIVTWSLCSAAALLLCVVGVAAPTRALPIDHIHLAVPDPTEAVRWYFENFGGTIMDEAPNRLRYGSTRLLFLRSDEAGPSAGSAIDHLGFSVADIEATMESLEANGVEVISPIRDIPGLFKLAFIEDPWGTRIEVVEDPDLVGLHHIHLRGPEPEAILSRLARDFGGERTRLKGRVEGVKYDVAGFSDLWILVQRGEATPSAGSAIDHIAWRVPDLNAKIQALAADSVALDSGPRTVDVTDGTVSYAYLTSPEGTRIELVQR